MSNIKCFGSRELAVLSCVFAIALSKDTDVDELNSLGNFIVGVGCIILVIAAQQQYLDSICSNENNNENSNKKGNN